MDGTLLAALPRIHSALRVNYQNRAAKLHLKFSLLRRAARNSLNTTGSSCGRKALHSFVKRAGSSLATATLSHPQPNLTWKPWRNFR